MANIQPQSKLYVFKDVMLDKSYKHAYYLGDDPNNIENFVNYLVNSTHYVAMFDHYTYFRENRYVIRVKCRADDLWEANYIAYQNPIIGATKPDKWFFGFVDETVYVNNETTDIIFTPDIMTTWWREHHLGKCYVERMHEPNDYFGKNLAGEPIDFGDYKYAISESETIGRRVLAEELVNFYPSYTLVPVGKSNLTWATNLGSVRDMGYDGVVSGYRLFIYDTQELWNTASNDYNDFMNLVNSVWSITQSGENILGFFIVPKDLIDSSFIKRVIYLDYGEQPLLDMPNDGTDPITKAGYYLDQNVSLDGYLPANVKMYSAPFCSCEVCAPNGDSLTLRHEYMRKSSISVGSDCIFSVQTNFRLLRNVFPPISIIVRPDWGYASDSILNVGFDPNQQLEFGDIPTGSWSWGIFQQWLVEKMVQMPIDIGMLATSLGGAMNVTTSSTKTMNREGERINHKTGAVSTWSENKEETMRSTSNAGEIHGIKQAFSFAKDCFSWMNQKPASRGKVKSIATQAVREASIIVRCLCPNKYDAERIDRFFTAYGYSQDKIMQPYRCTRANWTYLQTNDCKVNGNLPSEVCYELEKIYNSGVTFWTNIDNIGNYQYTRGANDSLINPKL